MGDNMDTPGGKHIFSQNSRFSTLYYIGTTLIILIINKMGSTQYHHCVNFFHNPYSEFHGLGANPRENVCPVIKKCFILSSFLLCIHIFGNNYC